MANSKAFLRALRKKYGLGEFKRAGRKVRASRKARRAAPSRSKRRATRKRPAMSPKMGGFLQDGNDLSGMRTDTYMRDIAERNSIGLGTND